MNTIMTTKNWSDITPFKSIILQGKNYHLYRVKVLVNDDNHTISLVSLNIFQRLFYIFSNKFLPQKFSKIRALSTSEAIRKINETARKFTIYGAAAASSNAKAKRPALNKKIDFPKLSEKKQFEFLTEDLTALGSLKSMDDIKKLALLIETYALDRELQRKAFSNIEPFTTRLNSGRLTSFSESNQIRAVLRWMVMNEKIVAYDDFGQYWLFYTSSDHVPELHGDYERVTKEKLCELLRYIQTPQVALSPKPGFSKNQHALFNDLLRCLDNARRKNIFREYKTASFALRSLFDFRQRSEKEDNEVLDYLLETNTIHGWTCAHEQKIFFQLSSQGRLPKDVKDETWNLTWRNKTTLQKEQDFIRNRTPISLNLFFGNKEQQEFAESIVKQINTRSYYHAIVECKLLPAEIEVLEILKNNHLIFTYECSNPLTLVFATEEDLHEDFRTNHKVVIPPKCFRESKLNTAEKSEAKEIIKKLNLRQTHAKEVWKPTLPHDSFEKVLTFLNKKAHLHKVFEVDGTYHFFPKLRDLVNYLLKETTIKENNSNFVGLAQLARNLAFYPIFDWKGLEHDDQTFEILNILKRERFIQSFERTKNSDPSEKDTFRISQQ
ncbi:MAG: hypothetical protein AB7E63_09580 [Parachlamydia sp.]